MKRTAALLLALCMLPVSAVSCGSKGKESPETTPAPETTVQTEYVTETELECSVPEELTLQGETVSVLNFDYRHDPNFVNFLVSAEEFTGEILNDSVYNANTALMEDMDFIFEFIDNGGDANDNLVSAVTAGDDIYDIVYGTQFQIANLVSRNMLANLNASAGGYIDTEKPWWYSGYISESTVDDTHTYFLAGDLSPDILRMSSMMLLNMDLLTDLGGDVNEIYDTVLNGEWTYDAMSALAGHVYVDTDGDGQRTAEDTYGFASYTRSDVDHFTVASGVRGCSRDEDGLPYITFNNEYTVRFVEALVGFIWDQEGSYYVEGTPTLEMLNNKRVLLLNEKFFRLDMLREADVNYTIIPLPKLDTTVENYSSLAHDISLILCIPSISANVENLTAVLEKMSYQYYKDVMPQYYEVILKTKYRRDSSEAAPQIMDMIHAGLTTDFAYFYNSNLNGIYWSLRDLIGVAKSTDFASLYAKNEKQYHTKLAELIDALRVDQ